MYIHLCVYINIFLVVKIALKVSHFFHSFIIAHKPKGYIECGHMSVSVCAYIF